MTNLNQTWNWFIDGFVGKIPVWAPNGAEVGYMTSATASSFTLLPGVVGKAGADLITKDFFGRDVPIKVTTFNDKTVNFTRPGDALTLPDGGTLPTWVLPVGVTAGAALVLLLLLKK